MARRRSLLRRLVILGIVALACFGGYTLYKQNQRSVDNKVDHVGQRVKAVKKALTEPLKK